MRLSSLILLLSLQRPFFIVPLNVVEKSMSSLCIFESKLLAELVYNSVLGLFWAIDGVCVQLDDVSSLGLHVGVDVVLDDIEGVKGMQIFPQS